MLAVKRDTLHYIASWDCVVVFTYEEKPTANFRGSNFVTLFFRVSHSVC